jgi:hypothetical protein
MESTSVVIPRVHVRSKTQLSRLSIVYANPVRLRIVTELGMEEMSPQGFYKAFGGGSLKSIERHFRILTDYGWLRFVRTRNVGARGRPQRMFRATGPAVFDDETWEALPYSIRFAFSSRTFEQLIERAMEAMKAGTFDSRTDRHLSWTPLVLDELGWNRVIGRLNTVFEGLSEEQADAKVRLQHSEEAPILMTVGLAGFLSPHPGPLTAMHPYPGAFSLDLAPVMRLDSSVPFTVRLAKVFADPLNLKIVSETNLRVMSAKELHQTLGPDLPPKVFHRRIKVLESLGWLIKVDTKTGGMRRGSKEHFYAAACPAIYDPDDWPRIPSGEKAVFSRRAFQQLIEKVGEAMRAGTFDARSERHWTWLPLRLDGMGWQQVISTIDDLFRFLFEERDAANFRLAASNDDPLLATVCILGFESPPSFQS